VLWAETPRATYAVIRYSQSAGFFRGPENACVAFADRTEIVSDSTVGGLVTFETLDAAKEFARSYGWKGN
jgi:hypothetical protein